MGCIKMKIFYLFLKLYNARPINGFQEKNTLYQLKFKMPFIVPKC